MDAPHLRSRGTQIMSNVPGVVLLRSWTAYHLHQLYFSNPTQLSQQRHILRSWTPHGLVLHPAAFMLTHMIRHAFKYLVFRGTLPDAIQHQHGILFRQARQTTLRSNVDFHGGDAFHRTRGANVVRQDSQDQATCQVNPG